MNKSREISATDSKAELILVLILLSMYWVFSFIQTDRLPISFNAWGDEIMFVDPAVNLYMGKGFTSAAWYAQSREEFWSGYPPLYSFMLYLWMQIVGFSLAVPRSLNTFLTVITAILLWLSVKRLNLVTTATARIGLMIIVLFTQNYTFNLASGGRPDPLMLLLTVIVLLIYSMRSTIWRYVLLVVTCALIPLTGLALIAYSVMMVILLLVFLKRKFITEAISIIIGIAVGILGLYGFYSANGVWEKFVFSTKNNPTLIGHDLKSALPEVIRFGGFLKNWNFQILLILLVGIAIYQLIKKQFRWRSLICFGLVSSFTIPFGMRFAGAFLFYNAWMVTLPLAVCLCSSLEKLPNFGVKRSFYTAGCTLLLVLCTLGPHMQLIDIAMNWNALDYAPVQAFIDRNVTTKDWVFTDLVPYYAVKQKAEVVMTDWYQNIITPSEKNKLSLLILPSDLFDKTVTKLGGEWQIADDKLTIRTKDFLRNSQKSVTLNVYKRTV
jgi:hypothetical protein